MTEARAALDDAPEKKVVSEQQRALARAVRFEETAIATLHALLHTMSQWGNFQELISKTRNLLDRQESLRNRTAELGKATLGKPVSSLTEPQAERLTRLAREQHQIASDVEQHLATMRRLAARANVPGQAQVGADAIDNALRAARAHDMKRQLKRATETIRENRTAAAALAQKAAADALRRMVDALYDRQTRELQELRKRLDTARDQVALLIEQQRAVRDATDEAGLIATKSAAWSELANAQRTLETNTRLLGEELAGEPRMAMVGNLVRRAAAPMRRAERRLREQQSTSATAEQASALAMLNEAIEELEVIAQATEAEVVRRSLVQIREALEAVAAEQREVNGGIMKLHHAIQRRRQAVLRSRMGRTETRAANRLARRQAGARAMIQTQLHEFEQVIVYRWALERVANWMDTSKERLGARSIDDDLVRLTTRIVHELETLIQAIVDTEALPLDTQFVESGDGGGEGGSLGGKPVPTVAELLVLKSMQVDINQRTQSLYGSIDIHRANEQQLQELTVVGEDQAEVGRLAELVTRRVREP